MQGTFHCWKYIETQLLKLTLKTKSTGMYFKCFILQALQRVNECLLEKNPNESLLFDVILMISDSQQQQQRSRIISSTRHHGNGEPTEPQSGTAQ